jgi:imidazolonepropionase-like amidohydrolase
VGVIGRALIIFGIVAAGLALPSAAPPPYFAIRDARIAPIGAPVIERGTIVFADGLIGAVGANADIPAEAEVIDGKGLTVYPGLIDALSETGLEASRAASGGGAPLPPGPPSGQAPARAPVVRGPEDRPGSTPWDHAADHLAPGDSRIEAWRSAGFTTVVATPKGGFLPGQSAIVNLAGERPGDMVVATGVALPVSLRASEGFRIYPGSLMGTIAYVRQVFLDARHAAVANDAYARGTNGQKRPDYDRTTTALGDVLARKIPVLLPATSRVQILRMLDLAQELSLPAILYGVHEGYDAAAEIGARKVPVLVSAKWPERSKDADPDAEEPLRVLRARDRAPSTPAALAKAGVQFGFYSDGLATPKEMLLNIRKAVDAGLDEERALRALTLDAASLYRAANRLGSLERGKIANAVVATGSLFDEKTTIKYVFVDGRKFEPVEPADSSSEAPGTPSAEPTVTLNGEWAIDVETTQGAYTGTATLVTASDGKLSGSLKSSAGDGPVSSGSLTGTKFTFTAQITLADGRQLPVTFNGTVEGNTMKGTLDAGDASGTFTGSRRGPGGRSSDQGARR